jgi:ABC-type sulfate transport system permease component
VFRQRFLAVCGVVGMAIASLGLTSCTSTPSTYSTEITSGYVTWDLENVDVARDGAFTAMVDIPANVPPGPATLTLRGSVYDDCVIRDGAACVTYSVGLTIAAPRT